MIDILKKLRATDRSCEAQTKILTNGKETSTQEIKRPRKIENVYKQKNKGNKKKAR